MAETKEECMNRWQEGMTCLSDDLDTLEASLDEGIEPEDWQERVRRLKMKKEELEAKIAEADGSQDAVWEEVQTVIDAFWDSLGAEVDDLKKKTS